MFLAFLFDFPKNHRVFLFLAIVEGLFCEIIEAKSKAFSFCQHPPTSYPVNGFLGGLGDNFIIFELKAAIHRESIF